MKIVQQVKNVLSKRPELMTKFTGLSASQKYVKIVEVSPRDGLQNEKMHVPTATKI